jgi:hypothetical protein
MGPWVQGGHCVSVEQKISKLFLVLPRKPDDLDFLNVIRSGRSSDQEVYEKVFKVRRKKVLAALYWLVEHNVLYKEYGVTIDPSNLDWMGDDFNEDQKIDTSVKDWASQQLHLTDGHFA